MSSLKINRKNIRSLKGISTPPATTSKSAKNKTNTYKAKERNVNHLPREKQSV